MSKINSFNGLKFQQLFYMYQNCFPLAALQCYWAQYLMYLWNPLSSAVLVSRHRFSHSKSLHWILQIVVFRLLFEFGVQEFEVDVWVTPQSLTRESSILALYNPIGILSSFISSLSVRSFWGWGTENYGLVQEIPLESTSVGVLWNRDGIVNCNLAVVIA